MVWGKKHKDNLIPSLKIVCFLAGLVLIVSVLDSVFMRKDAAGKFSEFYANAKEYDVLFTGISHMASGVSPMELWNDQGIASFNLAQPGNKISSNYWMIKEALRYSAPKLIVVDVRRVSSSKKITAESYAHLHAQFDQLPFSTLKLQACLDLFSSLSEKMEMMFPFILYHERWETLEEDDFARSVYEMDKGAVHYNTELDVYVPECEFVRRTEKKAGNEETLECLEQIIDMCRQQGIEVLLVNIPYLPTADGDTQLYENGVADVAEEYGVNYINFLDVEGIINFNTDLDDVGHLNDSGMKKITTYLGDYIRENYDIPDRREDTDYAGWQEDYLRYTDYKFEMLKSQKKADTYFVLLADKNVSSCVYVKGGSLALRDARYQEIIQNIIPENELTKLRQADAEGKDYLLLIDRNGGIVREYLGISENTCVETSFGALEFGRDGDGALYLRMDGEQTNYLLAANTEVLAIAIDAVFNTVRDIGKFEMETVSIGEN